MPALRLFGRRWALASDDVPFISAPVALFHAAWVACLCVGVALAAAWPAACAGGGGKTHALAALGGLLATASAATSLAIWLTVEGLKGSILDVHARRRVPPLLYAFFAAAAAEGGFLVYATVLAGRARPPCEAALAAAAPGPARWDPLSVLRAMAYAAWGVLAGVCVVGLAAWWTLPDPGDEVAWRNRCRCVLGACCCAAPPPAGAGEGVLAAEKGGGGDNARSDAAPPPHYARLGALFRQLLGHIDFSPSDLAAAFLLEARLQQSERAAAVTAALGGSAAAPRPRPAHPPPASSRSLPRALSRPASAVARALAGGAPDPAAAVASAAAAAVGPAPSPCGTGAVVMVPLSGGGPAGSATARATPPRPPPAVGRSPSSRAKIAAVAAAAAAAATPMSPRTASLFERSVSGRGAGPARSSGSLAPASAAATATADDGASAAEKGEADAVRAAAAFAASASMPPSSSSTGDLSASLGPAPLLTPSGMAAALRPDMDPAAAALAPAAPLARVSASDLAAAAHYSHFAYAAYGYLLYLWARPGPADAVRVMCGRHSAWLCCAGGGGSGGGSGGGCGAGGCGVCLPCLAPRLVEAAAETSAPPPANAAADDDDDSDAEDERNARLGAGVAVGAAAAAVHPLGSDRAGAAPTAGPSARLRGTKGATRRAILALTRIPPGALVFLRFRSDAGTTATTTCTTGGAPPPSSSTSKGTLPYFIALDTPSDRPPHGGEGLPPAVVLAIRGTLSAADVLTDALCEAERCEAWLAGRGGEEGDAKGDGDGDGDDDDEDVPSSTPLFAHAGILAAAKAVAADVEGEGVLAALLEGTPLPRCVGPPPGPALPPGGCAGWRLVVTGHSLGAGVAVLVALRLRAVLKRRWRARQRAAAEAGAGGGGGGGGVAAAAAGPPPGGSPFASPAASPPAVACWAFATPGGVACPALAALAAPSTVSVAAGKDWIPRLSLAAVERLRDDMVVSAARCGVPKVWLFLRPALPWGRAWAPGELFRPPAAVPPETQALLASFRAGLAATRSQAAGLEGARRFVAPGRLMLLRPVKVRAAPAAAAGSAAARPTAAAAAAARHPARRFEAVWVEYADLAAEGILLSPRMMADHLPDFLVAVLRRLAGVGGGAPAGWGADDGVSEWRAFPPTPPPASPRRSEGGGVLGDGGGAPRRPRRTPSERLLARATSSMSEAGGGGGGGGGLAGVV